MEDIEQLKKQVTANPYFEITKNDKIRCTLTGHEMPVRAQDYEEYQIVSISI